MPKNWEEFDSDPFGPGLFYVMSLANAAWMPQFVRQSFGRVARARANLAQDTYGVYRVPTSERKRHEDERQPEETNFRIRNEEQGACLLWNKNPRTNGGGATQLLCRAYCWQLQPHGAECAVLFYLVPSVYKDTHMAFLETWKSEGTAHKWQTKVRFSVVRHDAITAGDDHEFSDVDRDSEMEGQQSTWPKPCSWCACSSKGRWGFHYHGSLLWVVENRFLACCHPWLAWHVAWHRYAALYAWMELASSAWIAGCAWRRNSLWGVSSFFMTTWFVLSPRRSRVFWVTLVILSTTKLLGYVVDWVVSAPKPRRLENPSDPFLWKKADVENQASRLRYSLGWLMTHELRLNICHITLVSWLHVVEVANLNCPLWDV